MSYEYAACIVVRNDRGKRFQIHEFRGRRLFRVVRHFVLETGEPVRRIDFDHYEVAKTGQALTRV